VDDWFVADSLAFGADRSALLLRLAQHSPALTAEGSYLLTRPGRLTHYLGPCVATFSATARTLIERALQSPCSGGWSWDLFPENENAVAIARDLGFTPQRHLLRMVRGKDLGGDQAAIYAIAGFELG
jgi:hypothetical protein